MPTEVQQELLICHRCPHGWLNPLSELSTTAQYALARARRTEIFPAQTPILQEGTPVTVLYCIERGTAKAVVRRRVGTRESEVLLCLYKPGDILGLRDLFGQRRHSVTVIALEEVHACTFPAELVEAYARQYPQFWMRVAQLLAREIETVEEQLLLLQRRSTRERIIHFLLLLLRTYGQDEHGYIRFPITPARIAELLQTSVRAVQRTLQWLERSQLIHSAPTHIQVLNADALTALLHYGR
jgi:CRP-like cAMP-binding protein